MRVGLARSPHNVTGYGSFGANLVKGFRQLGVTLEVSPDDRIGDIPPTPVLVWAVPPPGLMHAWDNQYLVNYSMWEATRLPESFRDRLHNFDLALVPCQQNKELWAPYHPNVEVVPLGYDADLWKRSPRTVEREFRILTAGAGLDTSGGRKGFDLAVQAFVAAFPDRDVLDPKPVLVAKSGSKAPNGAPAWVETHHGWNPNPSFITDLVAGCHAYLGPSRGEGWGYWPQQALATGIPIVISDIPAHHEYAWVPGAFTAPVRETPAAYFVMGDAGDWWEPDADVLAERLRHVYDNYDACYEAAQWGAEVMAGTFTHRHMAQHVMALVEGELGREVGPGKWELSSQMFPVRVNRTLTRHECTVGNRSYDLRPGETYWLSSDVKRVLWEADMLDPTCHSDEPGRLPV